MFSRFFSHTQHTLPYNEVSTSTPRWTAKSAFLSLWLTIKARGAPCFIYPISSFDTEYRLHAFHLYPDILTLSLVQVSYYQSNSFLSHFLHFFNTLISRSTPVTCNQSIWLNPLDSTAPWFVHSSSLKPNWSQLAIDEPDSMNTGPLRELNIHARS